MCNTIRVMNNMFYDNILIGGNMLLDALTMPIFSRFPDVNGGGVLLDKTSNILTYITKYFDHNNLSRECF